MKRILEKQLESDIQGRKEEFYQALVNRDSSYLGTFFAAVKTTSVFCLPTCRARKPLPQNVEYFSNFYEAMTHGYRPCKICRPTENAHAAPSEVERSIDLVRNNPKRKIPDAELRSNGISPSAVRRWFQKHYGMSFHAYQRMYRINQAFLELKHEAKTTEIAYDSGYESLSGFAYAYKKLTGQAPSAASRQNQIYLKRITTPLGPMYVAATHSGMCLVEFTDRRMLETEFRDLQQKLRAHVVLAENEHILRAEKQLEEYFAGTRKDFDLCLDAPGSEFQISVWSALKKIKHGKTLSYQDLARHIGNPKAVRAVARANGANRIAIIIPCHRIIGKDGSLTGYGGGLERKRWLLNHEAELARALH